MAKSPENMSADERLKRIKSLERKVRELEWQKHLAERDETSCRRWAEEAWKEVRRLHDVCERHWEEKEQIRVAAGLPREAPTIPLAKWDHEARQWVADT